MENKPKGTSTQDGISGITNSNQLIQEGMSCITTVNQTKPQVGISGLTGANQVSPQPPQKNSSGAGNNGN